MELDDCLTQTRAVRCLHCERKDLDVETVSSGIKDRLLLQIMYRRVDYHAIDVCQDIVGLPDLQPADQA